LASVDRVKGVAAPGKPSTTVKPVHIWAGALAVGTAVSVPGLLFGPSAALAAALVIGLALAAAPAFREAPWKSETAVLAPFAGPGAVMVHDERILEALAAHELGRARRYERPLTLVSISLSGRRTSGRDDLVRTFAGSLRGTDLLGTAADGRVHIVLPETSGEAAQVLLPRFSSKLPPALAERVRVGVASFPEDEVTWVGLKECAAAREEPVSAANRDRDGGDGNGSRPRLPAVDGRAAPSRSLRRSSVGMVRRAVDVLVVVLAAPVVAPLIGLVALVVRLDTPGPTLVRHERLGRGGRRIQLLKLRTMVADADRLKQELAHLNVLAWPDFKIPNDPRVTRVGAFLRRTSLDELPQLWNVLRGELTLVGPRPCSVGVDKYVLWQTERLEATPGLFGRWQARGRAAVSFDERCRMDIGDLRSRSLRGELRVTFETLVALVVGRGAA
jgi:lipopolysaccharide/colanic/teichoic acid biosynthesis glycosyltransferase